MDRADYALREGFASEDHLADCPLPAGEPAIWDAGTAWSRAPEETSLPATLRGWGVDPSGEPKPMGAAQQARRDAFVTTARRARCNPDPESFEAALRRLFPARPRPS